VRGICQSSPLPGTGLEHWIIGQQEFLFLFRFLLFSISGASTAVGQNLGDWPALKGVRYRYNRAGRDGDWTFSDKAKDGRRT